jgi:membrane protease subunit (stomatin/prohibitin family)
MHKTLHALPSSASVLGAVTSLIIIGMLLAFHSVVRGAVQAGESRRQASAAQAEATWRCNLSRDVAARHSCRLQTLTLVKAI